MKLYNNLQLHNNHATSAVGTSVDQDDVNKNDGADAMPTTTTGKKWGKNCDNQPSKTTGSKGKATLPEGKLCCVASKS